MAESGHLAKLGKQKKVAAPKEERKGGGGKNIFKKIFLNDDKPQSEIDKYRDRKAAESKLETLTDKLQYMYWKLGGADEDGKVRPQVTDFF